MAKALAKLLAYFLFGLLCEVVSAGLVIAIGVREAKPWILLNFACWWIVLLQIEVKDEDDFWWRFTLMTVAACGGAVGIMLIVKLGW
jgi:hypothetical protein